ncbi:MAG: U32 family peptidase [Candidatus Woesearchaeota archaeon]
MKKNHKTEKMPKILAPVNDFTTLQAAIDAGADEIYFGIRGFNMRATAKNFSMTEMPKIVKACHKHHVKAFLALNVITYNSESKELKKIISKAKISGIDAIIAWDMAVIQECILQKIPIHLSTQNSISNYDSLKFYKKTIPNLTRVVLARECSLEDIRDIIKSIKKDRLGVEIETFIHGAMCVSVSGRCMLSHHLFGKSANRGECLQPCRRNYKTYEIRSTDHIDRIEGKNEFELGEDCMISPKDLCTLPFIEQLIDAGIDSFKIEGRNRSAEYVSTTVNAYRQVIYHYIKHGKSKALEELKKKQLERLKTVFNRGFSNGFYLGKPINEWSSSRTGEQTMMKLYVGKVLNHYPKANAAEIQIEDHTLKKNNQITIQGPTTGNYELKVQEMKDEKGFIDTAMKGTIIGLKVEKKVRKNDQVYILVDKEQR